ncbi:cell wall-binding repeat-containing protein [Candidatus Poriferisodalis sp.]|uniref:cell wall-binding repeat-containing protein n=1 Tax=Candidatus Poriferisodalis sp. TaxID=3101277 RepID=UPI003B59B41D
MTIYSKRRGWRSLAAVVVAMLVASVLAVVAGSPAQAANTSFEVRIDHDSNASTATVREFAGQDRYDTALRLAKNFAMSKGGLGAVPSAFVSSGETLVDSISVAGLAGYVDAPILLTPSGSLHGGVADFIEDYGVSTVYVLGGSVAVSDAAVTAIEGLSSEPKVTRIAGDDRYATAAAIASMIDAESSWCGTDAASAVLINGASDMMPYGVAVQTVAYRLQLPVLMTAGDMLPDATADFISENDVEHVQIIGGTGAVSAEVASALTTLGVDTVDRVDGDSAAAVSVALAQMAGNGCSAALGLVSNDRVALVRGNPDGVVAAPVLASSFASGYLVPPLVVGDSLPASVSDYLAATPKNIGANKLNLGIVAVGGTAAVSQSTMDDALEAAASSGALSVSIAGGDDPSSDGSDEGDTNGDGVANADDPVRPGNQISLYFSDDIMAAGDAGSNENNALLGKLRDIIKINGLPAPVTAASTSAAGSCLDRRVNVTLGRALSAGDMVSVAQSSHKFGTAADQRTVAPASASVSAPAPDRARPTAMILGIAHASPTEQQAFTVTFRDAGGFAAMDANSVAAGQFSFRDATGSTGGSVGSPTHDAVADGAKSFTVSVPIGRELATGDRLTVKPSAVKDAAGNMSAGASNSAFRAQASPRISAVLMSNLKHSKHNSWTVPAGNPFGTPIASGGAAVLTINAKGSGDAAGAAGNDWTITFDTASGYDPAKPLDIDVLVDSKRKWATVTWTNGKATVGDLLAALRANSDFDQRFSASVNPCSAPPSTPLVHTAAARGVSATTSYIGRTQFAIEVRFNAYIASANHDQLLMDVLAAAASRAKTTNDASGIRAAAADSADAAGGLSLASPAAVAGPVTTVRYEGETARVGNLPMNRDLVTTAEGHAGAPAITGPPAFPAITASPAVATGYAADANTGADNTGAQDKVDENLNGSSQNRITVTSSVKARN